MFKNLTALGGDVYAGGFTLGVQQAGFDVKGIVGHDKYGFATHKENFPKVPLYEGLDNWPLAKMTPAVDLFYTNPPCALWSSAGRYMEHNPVATKKRMEDKRACQYDDLADYAIEIGAKVWIWETVPRAWTHGRPFVMKVLGKHWNRGRHCYVVRFLNEHVGVPQTRERVFIITSERPLVLAPPPGFSVTAGEALKICSKKDKPLPSAPKLAAFLKAGEPGQKLRELRGRPDLPDFGIGFLWKMVDLSRPSYTVIGPVLGHPKRGTQLTINEYKALCTFPLDFKVPENTAGVSLLARGVAPLTAKWIAEQVRENLCGVRKSKYRGKKPEFVYHDFRKPDQPQQENIHDEL